VELVIRYGPADGLEDEALAFARRLFARFDEAIDALTLVPSDRDDLVVYLDGRLIHSLRAAGRGPRLADVLDALATPTASTTSS
jgi:hypothetical protein